MTAIYHIIIKSLAWLTGTNTAAGLLRLEEILVLSAAILFSWMVLAAVCYLFHCAIRHGRQEERF